MVIIVSSPISSQVMSCLPKFGRAADGSNQQFARTAGSTLQIAQAESRRRQPQGLRLDVERFSSQAL